MFILELTLRSWNHSEENKRRTLQRNDIAAAITKTDIFDFLVHAPPPTHPTRLAIRQPPLPSGRAQTSVSMAQHHRHDGKVRRCAPRTAEQVGFCMSACPAMQTGIPLLLPSTCHRTAHSLPCQPGD